MLESFSRDRSRTVSGALNGGGGRPSTAYLQSAVEILDRRLVTGEITTDEHDRVRKALGRGRARAPSLDRQSYPWRMSRPIAAIISAVRASCSPGSAPITHVWA
jgi:hypothetical protein